MKIIIPGNVISKKNGQKVWSKYTKGKRVLTIQPGDVYCRWEKTAVLYLKKYPKWEGGYPVRLTFYHYRKTAQPFDLSNMFEGPQDALQKAGIIAEDNMKHVIPAVRELGWEVDKENPRVEIIMEEI